MTVIRRSEVYSDPRHLLREIGSIAQSNLGRLHQNVDSWANAFEELLGTACFARLRPETIPGIGTGRQGVP